MIQFRFFIFALLFTATFKDDMSAVLSNSSDWSSLSVYPLFAQFKEKSFFGFPLMIAVGVLLLLKNKIIYLPKSYSLQIFFILFAFSIFRTAFYDEVLSLKVLIGALIFLFSYIYLSLIIYRIGHETFIKEVFYILYLFSIFYISVNIINNILGYGYVHGFPRNFGTTTHPNFLGVQIALCLLIIWARVDISLSSIIPFIFIFCGAWLLLTTGSRTGFLMLGVGLFTYIQLANKNISKYIILFLLCAFLFLFYNMVDKDIFSVFDRGYGGVDTRSASWEILFLGFLENPIFGLGFFKKASESSYLRMLVNYGVIYFILFIIMVIHLSKKILLLLRNKNSAELLAPYCLSLSLLSSLLIGGIFEGFLVDIYSFPLIIFFILCLISTGKIFISKLYSKDEIIFN